MTAIFRRPRRTTAEHPVAEGTPVPRLGDSPFVAGDDLRNWQPRQEDAPMEADAEVSAFLQVLHKEPRSRDADDVATPFAPVSEEVLQRTRGADDGPVD
jgi:hypothetical protein